LSNNLVSFSEMVSQQKRPNTSSHVRPPKLLLFCFCSLPVPLGTGREKRKENEKRDDSVARGATCVVHLKHSTTHNRNGEGNEHDRTDSTRSTREADTEDEREGVRVQHFDSAPRHRRDDCVPGGRGRGIRRDGGVGNRHLVRHGSRRSGGRSTRDSGADAPDPTVQGTALR